MALNLGSPWLSRLSPHISLKLTEMSSSSKHTNSTALFSFLLSSKFAPSATYKNLSLSLASKPRATARASAGESENELAADSAPEASARASAGESENELAADSVPELLLDEELLGRVSTAKTADEALEVIAEMSQTNGGVVNTSDCRTIIAAALNRNNTELALSVFYAMRSSFDQGTSESGPLVDRWKWSRPDVHVYIVIVQGLAVSLRVSDALRMIADICQLGVSPGEEVPFGKVVKCPSCIVAVAVAQPQHGLQIVSCAKCRYQYELVSGSIVSIESEEISNIPAWKRGLKFLQILEQSIPAAVHSVVVRTPSGMARTHRFATETVDLPAQEGERVTITLAAPSNVHREVGPFKFSAKIPNFNPSEPMYLTNHKDDRESQLLRAPVKDENSFLRPSILFPLLAVLASGDAISKVIDTGLPELISVAAVSSVAVGATLNNLVLPQLNKLPEKSVEVIAIKQQLLSQYDVLQSRIKGLKEAAEKEIWMLARMCQLENKIFAIGEPSYRARRSKVQRVKEGLRKSLKGRIELIDGFARIASMIEIEVEMDSDVLAAEAASNVVSIAEQIQQLVELENLQERWRIQVEANDEAERLLRSEPKAREQVHTSDL